MESVLTQKDPIVPHPVNLKWYNDAWDWTKGAAKDTASFTAGTASDAWDWTKDAAKDTASFTAGTASDAWDWTKGAAKDTVQFVQSLPDIGVDFMTFDVNVYYVDQTVIVDDPAKAPQDKKLEEIVSDTKLFLNDEVDVDELKATEVRSENSVLFLLFFLLILACFFKTCKCCFMKRAYDTFVLHK